MKLHLINNLFFAAAIFLFLFNISSCSNTMITKDKSELLVISKQGSFSVGGTVINNAGVFDPYNESAAGQSLHGDHAYIFYQIPEDARKLPLVFWHGNMQFSKTWETTPDGREGFQNIFLRRGFGVYLIDQPRRGNAGRSTVENKVTPKPDDQEWFCLFRIGIWPDYFPGVQFPKDPETLNQYFRQMTPNTGPFDLGLLSNTISELFNKIGDGILVTHSQAGSPGWLTAAKNEHVKAIISYEPGSNFVFPEGEVPDTVECGKRPLFSVEIPKSEFIKLTKIPIILYFGDYIPSSECENPFQEFWRVRLEMARHWRDVVNSYGGDVTIVHLPEIGIYGNTHFPFSDLNNIQIADLLSEFLHEKGLDCK